MIRGRLVPEQNDVARHYDELDRFYRELWGADLHHGLWLRGDEDVTEATRNLTNLVAERAVVRRGHRVCDVGCGYGGPARHIAERYGAHVVGLTLSAMQHSRAVALANGDPRVRFIHGDWLRNELPPRSFDAVIAIESASHMPDAGAFLRQCVRVLRPGGRLVIAAWLATDRPRTWQRRRLLEPICSEGRLAGLPTADEYRDLLAEARLRPVSFEDLSSGVRHTWAVCARRVCARVLSDPGALRYLFDRKMTERAFVLTVARMWLAYRTGALRYGLFTAES